MISSAAAPEVQQNGPAKKLKLVSPVPAAEASFQVARKTYAIPSGLFINNAFVESASGKKFDCVNPATGKPIVSLFEADKTDVDHAVEAAKVAFKTTWKAVSPTDKGKLMFKLADLMERDAQFLAEVEAIDNGKVLSVSSTVDIPMAIDCIRYYAGWASKIYGKTVDVNDQFHCYTKKEAFGVVAQIIPWNFPL